MESKRNCGHMRLGHSHHTIIVSGYFFSMTENKVYTRILETFLQVARFFFFSLQYIY